jgi:pyruvate,orthophosphate dikinase
MVKEKLITEKEAVLRVDAASLDQLLHPRLDPKAKLNVVAKGLSASPGAAVRYRPCSTPTPPPRWATPRTKVILVRKETTPGRHPRHGCGARASSPPRAA